MDNYKPLVSVIITTKNEEKNIENCLKSILRQSYFCDKIEIIVVDNYSTDKTKEIVLSYCHPELVEGSHRYSEPARNCYSVAGRLVSKSNIQFFTRGPERSAQRNFGVEKSKGDYFLYLDADMILSENVIRECVEKININKNLVGLYIPLRWVGNNWIIKAKGFEREFYDATCLDAVRFIRKDIFLKAGGFDERLYAAEDWDLDKRIKKLREVKLINSVMYHFEDENINLKDYIKKIIYYSENMNIYIEKWGKDDEDVKKQFSVYYRFFLVFIKGGKWKKIIRHPFLFTNMFCLKIFTGILFFYKNKF